MVKHKPERHSTFWSYLKVFAQRLREEATGWARDNILLGVVMLVIPPIAVYLRNHNAKLEWATVKVALALYAGLFVIFVATNFLRTMWMLDDDRIAEITISNHAHAACRQKLEEIEKATPKIKLKQPGAIFTEPVDHNFRDHEGKIVLRRTVPFLKVRFVNDPLGPYPSAKATDVRATINYYRLADGAHLLSIDGRWADSSQPPAIHPLASKTHLLATSFGIGEAHSLDIAYRDGETGKYFAWNNDNYNYPLFQCPNHLLEGDTFRVDVRLLGDWVDKTFSFTFKTTIAGFEI